jgi:hypothetical protein
LTSLYQRPIRSSPLLPWTLDEFHAGWDSLSIIELLLEVTWHLTVSGVVKVLSSVEGGWVVELVQLSRGKVEVILNTITISIINGVVVSLPSNLEEIEGLEIFWGFEDVRPVLYLVVGHEEFLLGSLRSLCNFGLGISLLLGISSIGLSVWVGAWLGVLTPSMVTWEFSISSVVEILNGWGEDHLSEFIESVLVMLHVILNTITIGVDDSSWLVWSWST